MPRMGALFAAVLAGNRSTEQNMMKKVLFMVIPLR